MRGLEPRTLCRSRWNAKHTRYRCATSPYFLKALGLIWNIYLHPPNPCNFLWSPFSCQCWDDARSWRDNVDIILRHPNYKRRLFSRGYSLLVSHIWGIILEQWRIGFRYRIPCQRIRRSIIVLWIYMPLLCLMILLLFVGTERRCGMLYMLWESICRGALFLNRVLYFPRQLRKFKQQVPEHTELNWILGTLTPMGSLNRMTQWKVFL